MRLAFMGTPDFAVPILTELAAAGHEIAAVYTRPPKPTGRGRKLTLSPVHETALQHSFDVRTPKNFKNAADRAAFAALDLEVAVVAAYGLILPQSLLDAPRHGCLNLHASLLPRWRGAAPIQRAIMAGDAYTGVQVMQMEAGLDTGPVLLSETTPIRADDTAASLHDRLSIIAAQLAPRALAALARDSLFAAPQPDEGVTYAEKINSEAAKIDWSRPAIEVDRHIRGLSPFPGAWTIIDGARIKFLMSTCAPGEGAAGEVLRIGETLEIACGSGAVSILSLQRAGKRPQSASEFLNGFSLQPGDNIAAHDPV